MDIEIGTDIVEISEFRNKISENSWTLKDVFVESEFEDNTSFSLTSRNEYFAGIFAAKEAFMKAYGKKVDWHDMWIEKDENGKPVLHSSLLAPKDKVKVSISHDGDYAVALVVIIRD